MIKYKAKYMLVKKEKFGKVKENQLMTSQIISKIKLLIGEKYFRILYTLDGFYSTFMTQYWMA